MGMDDVRSKLIQDPGQQTGDRQDDRKVATVEVLNRRDTHHIDLILRHTGKFRRNHQHPMTAAAILGCEGLHRTRHATDVRDIGIGQHDDVHPSFLCRQTDDSPGLEMTGSNPGIHTSMVGAVACQLPCQATCTR